MDAYISRYLREMEVIVKGLNVAKIEQALEILLRLRTERGRIFFLGLGGGAGNSSHAVGDFRRLAGIEAHTPTDNVCELSAMINDEGWEDVFVNWLKECKLNDKDAVFIFSVSGGDAQNNVSVNIIRALKYAKENRARIIGIVGGNGGYTAQVADVCVIIPAISSDTVTMHTESFQSAIWHLLVSHPRIKTMQTKWEEVNAASKKI